MTNITTIGQLEALYGEPNPVSLTKEVAKLTPAYRKWIEASPFMALATAGPGGLDCSPRGDPDGKLIEILDEATIVIPDRRGNNRLDSLRNIVADPHVALLFLVPGVNETLRVNGTAVISVDAELLSRYAMGGNMPKSAIIVTIQRVYFQCARALARARLWDSSPSSKSGSVPTAGQMLKSIDAEFDGNAYDFTTPQRQRETLY